MLDDTLGHGELTCSHAETGRAGRGTGDNVICISQTRGIFSDLFVIEGGGPGYGNRLTREKRLVHFNSCCW